MGNGLPSGASVGVSGFGSTFGVGFRTFVSSRLEAALSGAGAFAACVLAEGDCVGVGGSAGATGAAFLDSALAGAAAPTFSSAAGTCTGLAFGAAGAALAAEVFSCG